MTEQIVWGELPKSQTDNQTIDEAIAAAIAAHNDATSAHADSGQSIDLHKEQTPIDHPLGSVLPDNLFSTGDLIDSMASASVGTPQYAEIIAYGGGRFVTFSKFGSTAYIRYSDDFSTWYAGTPIDNTDYSSLAYGAGLFVAVGSPLNSSAVMTSPDGITWTSRTPATGNTWRRIIYANGLFVAVGGYFSSYNIMTSPDGITWTSRASTGSIYLSDVVWTGSQFVAVGNNGSTGYYVSSADGLTWSSATSVSYGILANIYYRNGLYVATGGGSIWATKDLAVWHDVTPSGANSPADILWLGTQFLITDIGSGSYLWYGSADGVNWTKNIGDYSASGRQPIVADGKYILANGGVTSSQLLYIPLPS